MSQTTHYNLNKPTGSSLVNPLVDTFPNWDIVDAEMYKNYNLGVSGATETVSQGVHAIVRAEADLPFFKFMSVANFSTGDTFTLDGVSVNVYTPDGLALKNGAFVSGATIIGYYNSSNHSVTLMLNTTSGSANNSLQLDGHDASYFAKASDVTIIGNTDISAIGNGTLTGGLSIVDTKANDNNTHIGNLASLTTTGKNSAVDAINEVNASVTQLNSNLSNKANKSDIPTLTSYTYIVGTSTDDPSWLRYRTLGKEVFLEFNIGPIDMPVTLTQFINDGSLPVPNGKAQFTGISGIGLTPLMIIITPNGGLQIAAQTAITQNYAVGNGHYFTV